MRNGGKKNHAYRWKLRYVMATISLVYIFGFASHLSILWTYVGSAPATAVYRMAGNISDAMEFFFPNAIFLPILAVLADKKDDYRIDIVTMAVVLMPISYFSGIVIERLAARWGIVGTLSVYAIFSCGLGVVSCLARRSSPPLYS